MVDADLLPVWSSLRRWVLRMSYLALGLNVYLAGWNFVEGKYAQGGSSVCVVLVIALTTRLLHFLGRPLERRRQELYRMLWPVIRRELDDQGASADAVDLTAAVVERLLP